MKDKLQILAAPCGVYCGSCPSLHKGTCYGCSSDDRSQKRISKWNCKIRSCCVDEHKFNSCSQCNEFPCALINRLQKSHLGEKKFRYREEIVDNLKRINDIGKVNWLKEQQRKYNCPECEESIVFYYYECLNCGYKMNLE